MASTNGLVIRNDALAQEISNFAAREVTRIPSKRKWTSSALSRSKEKSMKMFRLRSSPDHRRNGRPKSRWAVASLGSLLSRTKSEPVETESFEKQSSWHSSTEPTVLVKFCEETCFGRSTSLPEYYTSEHARSHSSSDRDLCASVGTSLTISEHFADNTISSGEEKNSPSDSAGSEVTEWPPSVKMKRMRPMPKIERDVVSPITERSEHARSTAEDGEKERQVSLFRETGNGPLCFEVAQAHLARIAMKKGGRQNAPKKDISQKLGLMIPTGKASQKEREVLAASMVNDTFLLYQTKQVRS